MLNTPKTFTVLGMTQTTSPLAEIRRKARQDLLLAALRLKRGNVVSACRDANVSRQTHYNWCSNDSAYRNRFESALAEMQDALNELDPGRIREAIQKDEKKAVDAARFIWGQRVIDNVKSGTTHPFDLL